VKQFLAAAAGKYDGGTDTGFDLVFIDPPYEITSAEVAENLDALLPLLNKNATVVVERSSRSETFMLPAQLTLDVRKDYGDTSVFWLELTE
jgi:16S rRNA (guanine966-N2)-methyltransferase